MLLSVLTATVGLLFLLGGGEILLRGAAGLAARLGLSPLLIGLTVVAAATSMPELVVVVTSGIEGVPDLGVGNVIGSNIANILLILGVAAVLWPIATRPEHVLRDGLVLLGATVLFTIFALTGAVGRIDGIVMLVGLTAYLVFSYFSDRRINGAAFRWRGQDKEVAGAAGPDNPLQHEMPQDPRGLAEAPAQARLGMILVFIVTGVGALIGGSHLLVDGAVDIAYRLGVSDAVIGLTLVAVGTSLPELATAIVAGMRRHSEPSTLPSAISEWRRMPAMIAVASSGSEVPTATRVSPITASDTPRR